MKLSDFLVPVNTYTTGYIDGSFAARDSSISWLYNNTLTSSALNPYATNASVGLAIASFATNSSVGLALNPYATNASVGLSLYPYATNASISSAAFAKNASLSLYVQKAGDTMTGGLVINTGGLYVSGDTSLYGSLHANNHVHVGGNLTVDGSLIYTNIQSINISTGFIQLNTGVVGAPISTLQSGIIVNRGSADPYVFVYDEDKQEFRIGIATLSTSTHYNDSSTQAVATREDTPLSLGIPFWNATLNRFDTSIGFTFTPGQQFTTKSYVDGSLATRDASIAFAIGKTISNMSFSTTGLNVTYRDTTGIGINYSRFADISTNNLYVRNIIEGSVGYGININGNVGIANSNPLSRLHITQSALSGYPGLGTPSTSTGFFLSGDTNLYGLYVGIEIGSGNAWMQVMRNNASTAYNLIFQHAGGNVGIGNTNPAVKCEVVDSSLSDGEHLIFKIFPSSRTDGAVAIGYNIVNTSDNYGIVRSQHGSDLGLGAGSGTHLFIKQSGNIGINDTNPTVKFVVGGDASISGKIYSSLALPEPSVGLGNTDSKGIYCNFKAGGTVSSFSVGYVDLTGRLSIADADASNNMPAVAINTTGGSLSAGTNYDLLIYGVVRNTGWSLSPGKPVYVSATGTVTSTRPTSATQCVQVIGTAISPNAIIFNPSPDFIVLK